MHPSYEDRRDAPDVVLSSVPPQQAGHLTEVWEAPFAEAGAADADVLHLHHLTPQHDAVARRWPHLPIVAHLHGTEIKFLEQVERRIAVASALGRRLADMPAAVHESALDPAAVDAAQLDVLRTTRWAQWRHGEHWLEQLRRQAARPTTW